jgi:hypothetical protein
VSSLEFNIGLWSEFGGHIAVQYWTAELVWSAHWSSTLNSRGSPVSSLEFNIGLQRESGGPIGAQY